MLLGNVARRLLVACATVLAVSAAVFFGTEALPGDAAAAYLGQQATPELLEQYRTEFGFDRPATERYVDWLGGVLQGDLGRSFPSGDPVTEVLSQRVRNTAVLTLVTLVLLIPLGLVLGVLAAVWRDGAFDLGVSGVALALIATPEFVVGSLLAIVFAVWLGLLPPVSLVDSTRPLSEQVDVLVLPVLTLLAASLAQTIRMVRACMIEVLRTDYVQAAVLKGASPSRVLFRHALPNALGPVMPVLAINVGWLMGGVVVVETVFQFPGLGLALTDAVATRNLPTVQAIVLLVTVVYVVVNALADVAGLLLNPRLRTRTA